MAMTEEQREILEGLLMEHKPSEVLFTLSEICTLEAEKVAKAFPDSHGSITFWTECSARIEHIAQYAQKAFRSR